MLRNFLKLDDPAGPLYGRYIYEVIVERFDRNRSIKFLLKSFREEGVESPTNVLE